MTAQAHARTTPRPGGNRGVGVDRVWALGLDDAPVAATVVPPPAPDSAPPPPGDGPRERIAVAGADGQLVLLEVATGEVLRAAQVDGGLLDAVAAPPGGQAAVAVCGPRGHGIWLPDGAGAPLPWRATRRWTARAAWNADRHLAVGSGRQIVVTDADLNDLWTSPGLASTVTDLCWMDRGRRVAATSYGGVTVHRRGQDDPVARYSYVGSHLTIAVPAGERWVATGNQDATIHLWRRVPGRGDGDELHMSGYPGKIARLAFDLTGRWLAADGAPEVTVWDFSGRGPGGRSPRFLPAHDEVTALAWSPSRTGLLATGGAEGRLAIWEPARGKPGKGQKPILVHGSGGSGPGGSGPGGPAVTVLTWVDADTVLVGHGDGQLGLFRMVLG